MPKRYYQVGEPCDKCKTPTIQGKNGAYCKPCYIQWAEAKKNGTPQYQPPVQQALPASCNCEETIAKIRVAFGDMQKRVQGLETLVESLSSKKALEFHQGVDPKVEIAAQMLGGEVDIPTINHIPWEK